MLERLRTTNSGGERSLSGGRKQESPPEIETDPLPNGRIARSLLLQQCIDLLGQADVGLLEKGVSYQDAVRLAIAGDVRRLTLIIERAVNG